MAEKYNKTEFKRSTESKTSAGGEFKVKESIPYENVTNKGGYTVSTCLIGAEPVTAGNYGVFFIAPRAVEIMTVLETHRVASTSGTLNLEILASGVALDSGNNVLNTAFVLSATADTPQSKSGNDLSSFRILKEGERLALVDAGTLTNQAELCVTVYFKYAGKGDFF